MAPDLFSFYRTLDDHNAFLAFKGAVSQEVLVELGELLRNKLVLDRKVKKVFSIFIEVAQNILHYSAERISTGAGTEVGIGVVMVCETDDAYIISSGNRAAKQQAELLKAQCEFLNSSSEEELKRHYNERLRSMPHEGSKGAGLGFIDMARKSDRPLECALEPFDDEHVFFVLKITVRKGK